MYAGFDSDYTTWLNRLTALGYTKPSLLIQSAQSNFFISLKGYGLFSRMKTGYFLHAGSAEAGTVNLKNPLTYQSTLVNSPTFSEGNGMKSNGTTSYINQPFKSDEYAGIENDITSVNYVSESNVTFASGSVAGCLTSPSKSFTLQPFKDANGYAYHFSLAQGFANNNHKGLYCVARAAASFSIYLNGVKTTFAIATEAPTVSINRYILGYNNNGTIALLYNKFVACDFLFNAFTDADELNFRTAFDTYKTAVGLP